MVSNLLALLQRSKIYTSFRTTTDSRLQLGKKRTLKKKKMMMMKMMKRVSKMMTLNMLEDSNLGSDHDLEKAVI